ncbi:PEP-CTERM sorting domain-containing protein [Dapis sp. BLCC M229]|uniref:PEP-CTERM sorting domain-containing protein n=1 Tax=Dapis sp. BLCC M229 TaxID=3400188 RepID=UPI003CF1C37C
MKQLFSSCFAFVSSAVLASSFAVFAPEAGQAFTLIDSDNDSFIDAIEDLAVDGSLFNVDFVTAPGSDVYSDGFDFDTLASAEVAASAVHAALGSAPIEDQQFPGGMSSNAFMIGYQLVGLTRLEGVIVWPQRPVNCCELGGLVGGAIQGHDLSHHGFFAVFTEAGGGEGAPTAAATTPEPSLILGFITLGGLMLGSRKKEIA